MFKVSFNNLVLIFYLSIILWTIWRQYKQWYNLFFTFYFKMFSKFTSSINLILNGNCFIVYNKKSLVLLLLAVGYILLTNILVQGSIALNWTNLIPLRSTFKWSIPISLPISGLFFILCFSCFFLSVSVLIFGLPVKCSSKFQAWLCVPSKFLFLFSSWLFLFLFFFLFLLIPNSINLFLLNSFNNLTILLYDVLLLKNLSIVCTL